MVQLMISSKEVLKGEMMFYRKDDLETLADLKRSFENHVRSDQKMRDTWIVLRCRK